MYACMAVCMSVCVHSELARQLQEEEVRNQAARRQSASSGDGKHPNLALLRSLHQQSRHNNNNDDDNNNNNNNNNSIDEVLHEMLEQKFGLHAMEEISRAHAQLRRSSSNSADHNGRFPRQRLPRRQVWDGI